MCQNNVLSTNFQMTPERFTVLKDKHRISVTRILYSVVA